MENEFGLTARIAKKQIGQNCSEKIDFCYVTVRVNSCVFFWILKPTLPIKVPLKKIFVKISISMLHTVCMINCICSLNDRLYNHANGEGKLVFTCKFVCDKHLSIGCTRQLFGNIYLRIRTIIWIVRNKNKISRKTGKKNHFRVRYCIQYFFIRGRKIVCTRA